MKKIFEEYGTTVLFAVLAAAIIGMLIKVLRYVGSF